MGGPESRQGQWARDHTGATETGEEVVEGMRSRLLWLQSRVPSRASKGGPGEPLAVAKENCAAFSETSDQTGAVHGQEGSLPRLWAALLPSYTWHSASALSQGHFKTLSLYNGSFNLC